MRTPNQIAAILGCTTEQVTKQAVKCSTQLRGMEERARRGKRVNGYTADELAAKASRLEALVKQP